MLIWKVLCKFKFCVHKPMNAAATVKFELMSSTFTVVAWLIWCPCYKVLILSTTCFLIQARLNMLNLEADTAGILHSFTCLCEHFVLVCPVTCRLLYMICLLFLQLSSDMPAMAGKVRYSPSSSSILHGLSPSIFCTIDYGNRRLGHISWCVYVAVYSAVTYPASQVPHAC